MTAARWPVKLHVEALLMIAMFVGFGHLVYKVVVFGYVPLPFVYDVSDTFMDWFNPAYWGRNGHAYSAYTSIYAPLSFVFTDLFGTPSCYLSSPHPKDVRECDFVGIAAIFLSYILCVVLAAIAFRKNDRPTWLYRSVGFGLGLPLLYALERGNLIMIGIIFLIAFFGLSKSKGATAFYAGMMINMKSYMLLLVLSLGIKREWRLLELCGFATVGVYLVTLAIYGAGTPAELARNLAVWFNAMSSVVWDQISYSTTYAPFLQFDIHQYPVREFIPDKVVNIATIAIKSEIFVSRLLAWICIGFAWLYPRTISTPRLAFFLIMQSFIAENPGGYGQSIFIFLVFMEKWTNMRVGIAIIAAYLISIPTDLLFASALHVERIAWLTNREVMTVYGLTIGALVRPGLIAIMLWALAIDSLIEFHREMRKSRPQLGMPKRLAPEMSRALA